MNTHLPQPKKRANGLPPDEKVRPAFTRYQAFMVAILTFMQFSIVLDFMVLSPLGAQLLDELNISTSQFGLVVSAYAFSAGAAGLMTAGFADKFDRKKLLLFFYSGFVLGTFLCALAPNYHFLLLARIVTGLFGGVMNAISFAIITDLFKLKVRGRVMGFVQMAFAASQVLGIPVGLLLANRFGWHSPFFMISGIALAVGVVIFIYMKPITDHLKIKSDRNPIQHLVKTISMRPYLIAFSATTLLATGGFMLMPFGSAFGVHNMGIDLKNELPMFYGIAGVFSFVLGPLIGRFADKAGKYRTFVYGSIVAGIMVVIYTNLGMTPFGIAVALNVFLFVGISARMISSQALVTGVPDAQDRGAFMSINSSVQQISGGVASAIAGMIVVQSADGRILHYDTLGYVVDCTLVITVILMFFINAYVQKKTALTTNIETTQPAPVGVPATKVPPR